MHLVENNIIIRTFRGYTVFVVKMNMKKTDRNNLVIKIQDRGNENFEKRTTQYFSRPATCCYPYYNIIICYTRIDEKIGYKNFKKKKLLTAVGTL